MSETHPAGRTGSAMAAALRFVGAFAQYAGGRRWIAAGLVAAGAVLEGAGLVLLIPILGVVVSASDGGRFQAVVGGFLGKLGAETAPERLGVLVAAFVSLMILRSVVVYARDIQLASLQTGFVEAVRNGVMTKLAAAPWSRVVSLRHARVSQLMSAEVQRIGQITHFLIQGSVALAMLLIQGGLAFALAPGMAAAAAVLLLLGAVVLAPVLKRMRHLGSDLTQASQALMSSAAGFMGGLKAALAQNAQAGFVNEFRDIQTSLRALQLEFTRRQSRSRLIFNIAMALAGATVVVAGFSVFTVEPAVLITLILIFTRMSGPALLIQQAAQNFVHGLPAFEAVKALEADLETTASDRAPALVPPAGPVVFHKAAWLHPGGGGLAEASLTLAPGEFLGVAGPSGAGKTTFVDLLSGLLPPQSGSLSVGGQVLEGGYIPGWRGQIAYVAQDPFLFHDTIRRNLTWADDAVSDAMIARALKLAGADGLVKRLEKGLDTVVGERGTLLSGGERQRIAIARALLRKPRLLILDEATNAIDVAGEAKLLAGLAALKPRPTIVMIAHRAESLAVCDRIVRIEDGRLLA